MNAMQCSAVRNDLNESLSNTYRELRGIGRSKANVGEESSSSELHVVGG